MFGGWVFKIIVVRCGGVVYCFYLESYKWNRGMEGVVFGGERNGFKIRDRVGIKVVWKLKWLVVFLKRNLVFFIGILGKLFWG